MLDEKVIECALQRSAYLRDITVPMLSDVLQWRSVESFSCSECEIKH